MNPSTIQVSIRSEEKDNQNFSGENSQKHRKQKQTLKTVHNISLIIYK